MFDNILVAAPAVGPSICDIACWLDGGVAMHVLLGGGVHAAAGSHPRECRMRGSTANRACERRPA